MSPISVSPQKTTKMSAKELEANLEQPDEQTYENTAFLGKIIAYLIIHIPDAVIYWLLHISVKDRLKPVPLDEFGAHVCRMHADRDKWFEMEYNVSSSY